MTKDELKHIARSIQETKTPVTMTKRQFVNAFGYDKRGSGNKRIMDDFLERNNLITNPYFFDGTIDVSMELAFKYRIKSNNFQLYSLYIEQYKNLKELYIDFEPTEKYCCFIGLNGSGKSNVIEAISAIFYSLHHVATLSDGLKKYPCEFKYKISYILNGEYIEIHDGKLKNGGKITPEILPKNVIVSYSGEDTRLWKKFYKPLYKKYCNRLTATPSFTPPFMFNISKYQWELSLLVLLYSEDIDVLPFVESITKGCECLISFDYKIGNLRKWEGTQTEALIEKFKEKSVYTVKEFRELINNISFIEQASTLFYCLYKCYTESDSQVITKINISFKGKGNIEGLSEGEKKMIIANTMIHILASKESLCMFDEPDSHIHLSRKTDLLQLIDTTERYNLITTHSPVFIDLMKPENVKYIVDGKIDNSDKIKQLSNLSGGQISYFDGAFILASPYTVIVEGTYDIKYIKKAINLLASLDVRYRKLHKLAFIPMGSADNTESFFNDVIINLLPNAKKLLYIFDYDKPGINGWCKVETLKATHNKLENIFYQSDYSVEAKIDDKNPKDPFYIEDMFERSTYSDIVDDLHSMHSYRQFKKNPPPSTCDKIKKKIETSYGSFDVSAFDGFKPLLDRLVEIFGI